MTTEGTEPPGAAPPGLPPPAQPPASVPGKDERMWGMFCHLFALVGLIGPLAVWLIKKDEYPFVNQQGKESLNWQFTLLIGFVICLPLCLIFIGFVLAVALAVLDLVFVIMASIKTNDGIPFKYPYRIEFLK